MENKKNKAYKSGTKIFDFFQLINLVEKKVKVEFQNAQKQVYSKDSKNVLISSKCHLKRISENLGFMMTVDGPGINT